jgi:hypothetical protein
VASVYADASLAEKELMWTAKLDLKAMCRDLWRWQSLNPNGYADASPASLDNALNALLVPKQKGPLSTAVTAAEVMLDDKKASL